MLMKIIASIFALYALRRLIIRHRSGGTLLVELLFWGAIFVGIGTVAFVPQSSDRVANAIGVSTGFNLLTFAAICFLLFAVFRLISKSRVIERELTQLVRELALASAERVATNSRESVPEVTAEVAISVQSDQNKTESP